MIKAKSGGLRRIKVGAFLEKTMEMENKKKLDRNWLYSTIKDIATYDEVDHLLEIEKSTETYDSEYIIEIFLDDDYS